MANPVWAYGPRESGPENRQVAGSGSSHGLRGRPRRYRMISRQNASVTELLIHPDFPLFPKFCASEQPSAERIDDPQTSQ